MQNHKSKMLFLAAVIAALSLSLKGQEFLPFVNDNYAGITGVHLNPASIANSRYVVDVSLVGVSMDAYNNYLSFNPKNIIKFITNEDDYKTKELLNGKNKWKNVMASANALNFMVSITPKMALAFTGRVRFFANMQNLDEDIATMFYNDRELTDHYYDGTINRQYSLDKMSINKSAFAEYGVTFASVLWESQNRHHFLKGGLTGKILQGLGAMYLNIDDLVFEFYNKDSTGMYGNASRTRGSNVSYGMSENLNTIKQDLKNGNYRYNLASKRLGAGFDIGFIYEWRPDGEKYEEEMDCQVVEMKYANKYKLRIGLSITDIGWLTYKKGANSNNFILNGTTNLKEDFDNLDNSNGKISSHNQRINELIATNQAYQQGNETETFKTTLPMAISLQVDYHLWKGFYLNFTPFISLYQAHNVKDDFAKIHSYSIVSLAPRFEHKWFGISVPLQYNQMSERGFALGLGLRMGPLWIGTNDLLSLCSRDIYGMNLQAALKVPIMYNKKRDSDGDHISDRKDKCKAVSGVCQYQGCPVPDNDKDGVPDRDDECPQIRGIKALKGCPDSDGDGIADKDDECPDIVGLQQFNGCPDTDGDAIPDRLDSCPDEHGPADNNGCPKKAPIDYTGQILFKANKTSLVSSSYPLLDSLVSIINNNPEYYITVDGHTDSSGNSKSNIKLSQKRAEAIRDYLLKKEIAPERVIARGYGDTKPIVDNKTVESRAKNRRVEINLATPFIQEEKSTKFDIPTGGIFDTKDNQADSLSTAFNVPTGDIFDAKDNQADSLSTAFNIPTWYIFDTNDNPADSLSSKNVKTKIEAVIAQMENAIYFDSDKYELKKEAIKVLDKKIALLRKYPDMRVSLVAHNCTLIKDELNDLLSENQIEMARFYMISQGISSHRLTNVLIDKKFSTYPNTTEYNSNHNKCVGFIVME